MGICLTGQMLFSEVLCCAMIRDAHGRKMGKSLGNVIEPIDVIHGPSLEQLHQKMYLEDLLAAVKHAKHGIAAASVHHKRPGSLTGSLAGYINPSISTGGTEWIAEISVLLPPPILPFLSRDFVASDHSELKRTIMSYNDDLDHKSPEGFPARLLKAD
ncbi:hypothetical protein DFJ58DRAFT_737233 [Suillus subalutaceus]|uniref:uncharacterized protein n=1 Tax=Suillus subalutaceus TaxID=48586 RepID=UPI001B87D39E|nr:uncharacterized protein DFJ58DRAFT_737233 [Suillus subalutaceus]KAG1829711.1 hypothetical protein DFJ58DRAFT_737233 [Suillus subalutaceus]